MTERTAAALHLFVLAAFAVAQPLYDLLGKSPEFFVARHAQPVDILLLVGVLSAGGPTFLVGVAWGVGRVAPAARGFVQGLFVAGGATLCALPALITIKAMPDIAILACAILLGAAFAFGYIRFHPVRTFLSILSPAVLLFPGLFLAQPEIFKLIRPHRQASVVAAPVPAADASVPWEGAPVPIVFLVFDELPTTSLMQMDQQIDADRFPHFAALAENATWFRGATSVSDRTTSAVPAILTGAYPPGPNAMPTEGNYPNNLFTWLAPRYNLDAVYESYTLLCPARLCEKNRQRTTLRMRILTRDLAAVYVHRVLPARFIRFLPPAMQTWEHFSKDGKPISIMEGARRLRAMPEMWRDRAEFVRNFMQSIGPTPTPSLHFMHTILPHKAWEYFPDGTRYNRLPGGTNWVAGVIDGMWVPQEDIVAQAHRRHLAQVGLVDALLGELLAHLKAVGMYDETLLVVTADHGASFQPASGLRPLADDNRGDILSVPLFIKAPHQQRGEISDRNVETVDILPTLADLLHRPLPWPVDGRSALDTSLPDRIETQALSHHTGKRRAYRIGPELRQAALVRKFAHLNPATGLSGPGPVRPSEWLGRRISDLATTTQPGVTVVLNQADLYEHVDPRSGSVPALITGQIEVNGVEGPKPHLVAVAINGVIRGGAHTFDAIGEKETFSVFVEQDVFREGQNEVSVYVVSASETGEMRLIRAIPK
jgi:hypothetical protein